MLYLNTPAPFPPFEEIPAVNIFVIGMGALLFFLFIVGLIFHWLATGEEDYQIVQTFLDDWEKLGDPTEDPQIHGPNYAMDLDELRVRTRAGKQLGAPTDLQAAATARNEKELDRRTNRITYPAVRSSNADFHGPRDDR